MYDTLFQHVKKFIPIHDGALEIIARSFVLFEVQKKEIILNEEQLCTYIYFVSEGCLRLFYTDEKGTDQTIQFALETWWMTDIDAFHRSAKSSFCIQAVEDSLLLGIKKSDWDTLLEGFPEMEKYFRQIYERAYAAAIFRMKYLRLPKDEIYKTFISKYPEFVQRIPQKLLASFLGFTPEYLSELRKKK
ncbi:Crp/Fnr family transcriptional regulator [Sphingobacterium pedocola]|uniref:Crp/Fnr family transcriptional regulator n=1 Tax=Sphingobacterium pedocola TaxID=2082722 RepID=A0ABR9T6Z3_9SPHI|nr:Crp/Fnr family transcriptional regulator [Sphingobacterium pedocola]MBE8721091.1 Crp/Fnr family transcriptional regulator [Sphingobacterium pedocola]